MSGNNYGHNGGRQQRKRPRDFDDDQYRRPRTFDTLDKLKRDLLNLTDPGNVSPIEDIRYVARKLAVDYEVPEMQERILSLLRDCILQLNVKTPQYAAVVSLAGSQNQGFANQFIVMLAKSLEKALDMQRWRDVKLFLRLTSCINRSLLPSGQTAYSILTSLVNKIEDAGLGGRVEYAERLCEVIMLTMPYLIAAHGTAESSEKQDFDTLLVRLEPYMTIRKESRPAEPVEKSVPHRPLDALDVLYRQCKTAVLLDVKVDYLPSFIETLASDIQDGIFDMPEIMLPAVIPSRTLLPVKSYFQIFQNQPVQSVPNVDELAASVFRDLVADILDLFVSNRKDAARYLIDLESYLPPNLFVLRGTPLDKISSDGPTWKAEDIVVEGIFSQLLTLPAPRFKAVYYHSVLTELCKLVPQAIAPTFGRAIRAIYQNLEHMEAELAYRFWDWFSHHLSNFGFNWKWQEWIPDLGLPPLHPKSVFIREAIAKEAELSYNQRIKTTLPSEYHDLISDEAPGPNFPHNIVEDALYDETAGLVAELAGTGDQEKLNDLLRAISRKATDLGLEADQTVISILVQSVLQIGYQSFSHALNTIERNLTLLQMKCDDSPSSRLTTVSAVMSFWSGRPFVASTLLQKLLNYRIIDPISILRHVLLESPESAICTSTTWELIATTMGKVNVRVTQVRGRLERMKQDRATRQSAAKTSPKQSTVVDKDDVSKIEGDTDTKSGEDVGGEGEDVVMIRDPTSEVDASLDAAADETRTSPEDDAELEKLERTWTSVQAEQEEVLTFVVSHFTAARAQQQQQQESDDAWAEYWKRGLFHSILRQNKEEISALGDKIGMDAASVERLLQDV